MHETVSWKLLWLLGNHSGPRSTPTAPPHKADYLNITFCADISVLELPRIKTTHTGLSARTQTGIFHKSESLRSLWKRLEAPYCLWLNAHVLMVMWVAGGWRNKEGRAWRPACTIRAEVPSALCTEAEAKRSDRGCSKFPLLLLHLKPTDQVSSTWSDFRMTGDNSRLRRRQSFTTLIYSEALKHQQFSLTLLPILAPACHSEYPQSK